MKDMGFIDVHFWEPTIRVQLVYATPDNFMKKTLYRGITKAWLHPRAGKMLIRAQEQLRRERPDVSLLVYDAARPMSVQREMWAWAKRMNRTYYVADPSKGGGLHNYGMAVDVTLIDSDGKPSPLGTALHFVGL